MTVVVNRSGEESEFDPVRIERDFEDVASRYPNLDLDGFTNKISKYVQSQDKVTSKHIDETMELEALGKITAEEPDWTYVASDIKRRMMYSDVARLRNYSEENRYGSLYDLVVTLHDEGVYAQDLVSKYTRDEIEEIESFIDPDNDKRFTYLGLFMLENRYLAKDHNNTTYELPQERFIVIAMTLMQNEDKEKRLDLIKEAYWALGNLYMTVATPTLSNSGKTHGQLSSCFIDTVDDSLDGIFSSNLDVARLSKDGGGIGMYLNKIRSSNSSIKGYKGKSSGVLPWMKHYDQTAVSVDQLGQRNGAIAVYLGLEHRDIFKFLDSKLNNGDERERTHNLFLGVCIPDEFMRRAERREDWYIFDPHTVKDVMGFELDETYDEELSEDGDWSTKYRQCIEACERGDFGEQGILWDKVPAIEVMKRILKSQYEKGVPYMFYRDTVNRLNANKHTGIVYCSNLCTEITQNQSVTRIEEEYVQDGKIIRVFEAGDFVVCNLSSISLANAVPSDVLERLIKIEMRMLDNVIDLNQDKITVQQANLTNQKYRAVGLGTFGWHHLLAKEGIRWESEESVEFADKVYEDIAYYAIKASHELALEKGAYPMFEGSDWHTGEYFERRGYVTSDGTHLSYRHDWGKLMDGIKKYGIRNGYLMAVAPNASTAKIGGSTDGIDPVFKKVFAEEKKDFRIPVTVPDLNAGTMWLYKSAYNIDQLWSIRQNAKRQKHIDQSVSFNLYIRNDTKAKDLLNYHLEAWRQGIKTTYYVRSTSLTVEECESCAS